MTSSQQNTIGSLAPFRPGDQLELPVPGVTYYPDHPLMQQLNQACAEDALERFRDLLAGWQGAETPEPPRGPPRYPMATVEPCLYHAVRLDRPAFVAHLLDHGVRMCRLAGWEAISHKCSTAMWDVFVEHGRFDINAPFESVSPPPLAFVLHDEVLLRWFLAHGADPNAESAWGLTPFLKAVGHAPLSIVKLLHQAGGSPTMAVAFVCQTSPPIPPPANPSIPPQDERLQVLRYVLDLGADPNIPKWVHNGKGASSDFAWASPLNAAISGRRVDLAEELLRRGARTDIPTFNIASRGETALELAARYAPSLVPLVQECRAREQGYIMGGE
ncbi:hypothetical protein F5Y12DRAFT_789362 [Xylaria sp. FL1777]|nr:hypothetical protein F5Y12DRAFT_789362 [Xylaria sp. FL1777]